jgi:hypothetical protein
VEAILHGGDPMSLSVPFAHQDGTWFEACFSFQIEFQRDQVGQKVYQGASSAKRALYGRSPPAAFIQSFAPNGHAKDGLASRYRDLTIGLLQS